MLISTSINQYISDHTSSFLSVLDELERETYLKVMLPHMISGKEQGLFLKMMVQISKSKNVLEIGTFTGYAALCIAAGLPDNGTITALEINPELEEIIRKYFVKAKLEHKLNLMIGDGLESIATLNGPFDLVFIDADKQRYSLYYDAIFDLVSPGGIILADNVLWSGKVVEPNPNKDTQAILDFNKKIQDDPRVQNTIIPMRDGIMMIRKL
jgi:caffeoyl-CoA O-methyltransferase